MHVNLYACYFKIIDTSSNIFLNFRKFLCMRMHGNGTVPRTGQVNLNVRVHTMGKLGSVCIYRPEIALGSASDR